MINYVIYLLDRFEAICRLANMEMNVLKQQAGEKVNEFLQNRHHRAVFPSSRPLKDLFNLGLTNCDSKQIINLLIILITPHVI